MKWIKINESTDTNAYDLEMTIWDGASGDYNFNVTSAEANSEDELYVCYKWM